MDWPKLSGHNFVFSEEMPAKTVGFKILTLNISALAFGYGVSKIYAGA